MARPDDSVTDTSADAVREADVRNGEPRATDDPLSGAERLGDDDAPPEGSPGAAAVADDDLA